MTGQLGRPNRDHRAGVTEQLAGALRYLAQSCIGSQGHGALLRCQPKEAFNHLKYMHLIRSLMDAQSASGNICQPCHTAGWSTAAQQTELLLRGCRRASPLPALTVADPNKVTAAVSVPHMPLLSIADKHSILSRGCRLDGSAAAAGGFSCRISCSLAVPTCSHSGSPVTRQLFGGTMTPASLSC